VEGQEEVIREKKEQDAKRRGKEAKFSGIIGVEEEKIV
jgi:hypothetical protein